MPTTPTTNISNTVSFKCRKFDIQNELAAVAAVADGKNRDEIYCCAYFNKTDQSTMAIAGSSKELLLVSSTKIDSGSTLISKEHLEPLTMAIDADKFLALCKKLPDKIIEIIYDKTMLRATVRCDASRYQLACQEPTLFPSLKLTSDYRYKIPLRFFRDALRRTIPIVSGKDSPMVFYSGILLSLQDGVLEIVATDGARMVVCFTTMETEDRFLTIIPKKSAVEMLATMESSQQPVINLEVTDNHAIFNFGKYTYRTATLAGSFPNYSVIMNDIRSNTDLQFRINRLKLQQSIERCLLFASKNGKGIDFNFKEKELVLGAANDKGETAFEVVEAECKKPYTLRLNGEFVSSYLDTIATDESFEVITNSTSHIKPVLMRSLSDRNYLVVLVPMELL